MATHIDTKHARSIMGKLGHGKDLLEELTAVATAEGITLGRVEALGALKRARLGFYDQEEREYEFHEIDETLELTNLVGNISLKDGAPIVHAHVTLSDREGRAFGGHLAPGSIIFACEFVMQSLEGPTLTRARDDVTGLPLWEM
jgi:hypothetical protein